jgi:hypothetical protein
VIIGLLVFWSMLIRGLFWHGMIFLVVEGFVDCDAPFFNEKAVCGNAIALFNKDNISNNEVSHWNRHASPVSTSVYSDFLIVDFVPQREKLLFLFPIAKRGDRR